VLVGRFNLANSGDIVGGAGAFEYVVIDDVRTLSLVDELGVIVDCPGASSAATLALQNDAKSTSCSVIEALASSR
jgi:hypothetical protein